jgi:arylsulfatase A-like enzyme/tetratricopeptide (TPR) repeat protein
MVKLDPARYLTLAFGAVLALNLNLRGAFASPPDPGNRPPMISVVLISVDTLRADHLSCYGYRRIQTMAIDSIAKGGTLFAQINSQVPLTFPSHVSLLTSTYPISNGIEDNSEVLGPNAITLATVLKSQGYHTGAFVGGFTLDRRFGLDQGFDFYDSPFNLNRHEGIDPSDLKRVGEDVTKSAEAWLDKNAAGPFFLFLHLFDLHTPYELPAEARARFGNSGYDAELRYIDETLGQFRDFLREKNLLNKTLIVFLSDHGESLGEHGEATHGYFIYQSTLHVPLIIHWPDGTGPFPARINEPASLLDVAPTILQFLDISRPPQFQGRSLLELLRSKTPHSPREVYSESLYAHNHYRCSPLRSLRDGRYKYIEAPKPELYDLDRDPHELNNLYSHQRSLGLSLRERLLSLLARYSTAQPSRAHAVSPEVVERLSSLGYVAVTSGHRDDSDSGADPKDRIVQYEETHRAISIAYSGRLKESVALLENVLAKTPDLPDARNILGMFQQKLGRHEQAVKNFRDVLREDPLNVLVHYNLAVSYFNLNRPEDAIKELNAVLAIASDSGRALEQVTTPAKELLGTIWIQQKEYSRARTQFEQLLTVAPRDYVAHYNLGWLAGLEGNVEEGLGHLQVAVEVEPKNAEAHNALGSLYLRQGDLPKAQDQFAEATRLSPGSAWAHYNLGVVFAREKNKERAVSEFKQALQADPNFRPAREALRQIEGAR